MPPPEDLSELSDHVVVCGLHDEGLRVVEELHRVGIAVVVVDDEPDPRLVGSLSELGVPLLDADSRRSETLTRAGLTRALALVCAESDDLHTLATALLARDLAPEVRVVVQLGNAAVARAMGDIGIAVLDAAALSAPSIVEAALLTGRRDLDLDERYTAVEVRAPRGGTLREVYGDLVPLAVVRAALPGPVEDRLEMAPGRDVRVDAGDTVVILGTAVELDEAGLARPRPQSDDKPAFTGARGGRQDQVRRTSLLRSLAGGLDRRVQVAVLALLLLAGTSVGVLLAGYQEADGRRMSPLDALYFTIETIGTVGYGDFYFRDQPWWLRSWAIGLMVVGATLATVFFALLTNALVSRRLEASLGSRRITGMRDHVIVVGCGSVGVAVTRRLYAEGVDVVVVERDEDNRFLGEVRSLHVPVVVADATLPDTWARLQLDRARAVVVSTANDLANIETGLAVRDLLGGRWGDVPVVLRLFDRALAGTVRSSFDFHHVRSPAAMAAPWFVGAVLGLAVLDTFVLGEQTVLAARMEIDAASPLAGRAMGELGARLRVMSLGRADGTSVRRPRRDERLAVGDTAYLVGPYDELIALVGRPGITSDAAGLVPRS